MTTDTIGGVWTFTLELAREFSADGIEVVLAALGGAPAAEQLADAARVPNLRLLSSNFKLEWMDSPWADVEKSSHWLLNLERDYRPDIVHLNSLSHGDLPWSAPVVSSVHSCVLSWWRAVKNEPAPSDWDQYRRVVRCSLQASTLVATPTAVMAASVADDYDIPFSNQIVIPNSRDKALFCPAAKEPFVLTAGRLWDQAKNVTAVASLAPSLPWPIYAAGNTGHPNGGNACLDGVRLLGSLSGTEVAHWMSRAAVFALPARYEPFGLSALEAGLSGCALILGDIPSQHEVWGGAALFVSPDDQNALITAALSLIENENLRVEMARRSYTRALTFSPARTANLYLDAYQFASSVWEPACVS